MEVLTLTQELRRRKENKSTIVSVEKKYWKIALDLNVFMNVNNIPGLNTLEIFACQDMKQVNAEGWSTTAENSFRFDSAAIGHKKRSVHLQLNYECELSDVSAFGGTCVVAYNEIAGDAVSGFVQVRSKRTIIREMRVKVSAVATEDGFFYVGIVNATEDSGQVWKFGTTTLHSEPAHVFGEPGSGRGEMGEPTGLAIFNAELYVVDRKNDRVKVFDTGGTFIREWGSNGRLPGEFNQPTAISVDNDRVYVTDSQNYRVQVFGLGGNFHLEFEFRGFSPNARGGVFARGGFVYVANNVEHKVIVFTCDGDYVSSYEISHGSPDGLMSGICAHNGHLLVCDVHNSCVSSFI